jgi:hypothetical protein
MIKTYSILHNAINAPELAQALGDMILAWSYAERHMSTCFAVMLNSSLYKASRLYQKLPNYRSRTQALCMLIELHPEFEPIKGDVLKLSSLSKTRNDWVHGGFIKGHGEIRAINLDEGLGSDKRSKPIKAADITNHAKAVRERSEALNAVLKSLPEYRVWSETQPEGPTKV